MQLLYAQDRNNITKYKNVDTRIILTTTMDFLSDNIKSKYKSIDAALSPPKTDYLYYVNRKDGKAIFAKTLEEHNNNIKQYLIQ